MSKTRSRERRAHPRHEATLDVHGTPDQGGVAARMVARNLSLGGLYCTSTADFAEMTRLSVRLLLPLDGEKEAQMEPVDVEAVVVRREELPSANGGKRHDLALFFTGIDEDAKGRLAIFLEQRAN